MRKVLKEALAIVKPTKDDEAHHRSMVDAKLTLLKKSVTGAKVILGGSGEKGTWLRETTDVDFFVQFPYAKYKDRSDELADLLEKSVKKAFATFGRVHGSRDYFQFFDQGKTFEVIPILGITKASQAKNITDVSPLHASWVKKHGKKYLDEIRLLKAFCRAKRIYGAESFINGFSGYVCEVLVIHFKGFGKLVTAAKKWGEKVVLDPAKYWKGSDVLMELNSSKTACPLVIVDPVQSDRNAAAAIGVDAFSRFVSACTDFASKPTVESFIERKLTPDDLRKKAGRNELVMVDVLPVTGKVDLVGCKLLKVLEFFERSLQRYGFTVVDKGLSFEGNALLYVMVKKEKMGPLIEISGPPLAVTSHAAAFKKKHKKTKVKGKMLIGFEKRKYFDGASVIADLKGDVYLKEKVKRFTLV
ncbi:MAG: nucleotidyltransferase domain-containing protein [Nanoarchaeota archaeon]|nr:nucleotidyltransferase domain-containing protein [Nanoarchaeota archaeon]